MRRAVREIRSGINPGEGAKIVDEMHLIKVSSIQRDIGPLHRLAAFHAPQCLLEAADAAKHLWRESGSIPKSLDESFRTQANLFRHTRYGAQLRLRHEPAQRESDGAARIVSTAEFSQQNSLHNLEPIVVCGHL